MNESESWENYPIDEEIDNSFAPLMPLTPVKTTEANLETLSEIFCEEWFALRKWGAIGMVVDAVQENQKWFEILHSDGSIGYYHYTEIEIRRDDEGGDDGDDDSPRDPDNKPQNGYYIVPSIKVEKVSYKSLPS
ncbi:MAG: hypothetical protein WC761_05660 [Candidatus Paceibacterota bacterium]|jgi:hypothetical protein